MNGMLDRVAPRAGSGASTASLPNHHHAAINIGGVLSERSDPVRNYGPDQPRLVVIGLNFSCLPDMGDFAVPMIFKSFHDPLNSHERQPNNG